MKLIFRLLFFAAVAGGGVLVFRNKPELRKLESTTLSVVGKTQQAISNAVKESPQRADVLETNVANEINSGVQQVDKSVTNAVQKVKEVETNAVGQVKESVRNTKK